MRASSPRLNAGLLGVPKGEAKAQPQVTPASTSAAGGKVALTLRINPQLHDRLRREAFEQRRPMQDIIIEAVTNHLGS